jgi:uncharacterized membrane protein YkvA (DUF1232 family)
MAITGFLSNRIRLFKRDVWVLFFAVRHPATPVLPKALALFTIIYLVSPLDAIPDFIPFFGYLDDLVITPFLISASVQLLPLAVKQASELKARKHSRRLTLILLAVIVVILSLMVFLFIMGWKLFEHLF